MAITRDMGPSKSQSVTYEAVGVAEDMSKIITNIEPESTYFLTNLPKGANAKEVEFGWLTEGLTPPKQNAHPEKVDYEFKEVGSVKGLSNYAQHFLNTGYVSDVMRLNEKVYEENDEYKRQLHKAMKEQARDMEYMIVNNSIKRAGAANTGALSGGIPYFMQSDLQDVTLTQASGLFTTATEHNLVTGDFIYFTATTLPDGLSSDICYYVDVLTDKTFNIYDTLQDAAEKVTANMVKPSTAGTAVKIKKNNIVDKEGKGNFTVADMQVAMQMAFNRGGSPTDAFMSGSKKQQFSTMVNALATTVRKSNEKKMETIADTFSCDFGTVTAHAHRLYPDNRLDLLDMNYWELKWFMPSQVVANLPKVGSYENFAVEGWLGLKGTQPNASASIIRIKRA